MRIEWITACREFVGADPDVDLRQINLSGAIVEGPLPAEIPVTLAACLLVSPEEAKAGGVSRVVCGVFRPGHQPEDLAVGQAAWLFPFQDGDTPFPDVARRTIVSLPVTFTADEPGAYTIAVKMEDLDALTVPYGVVHLPTT